MSNQVRRIDRGRVIDRDLEGRGRETKLGEENSLGRHQVRGKKRLNRALTRGGRQEMSDGPVFSSFEAFHIHIHHTIILVKLTCWSPKVESIKAKATFKAKSIKTPTYDNCCLICLSRK